jgi:hypothetical protein
MLEIHHLAVHGAIKRILHNHTACDAAEARIAFALAAVIIYKKSTGIDRVGIVRYGDLEVHMFEHSATDRTYVLATPHFDRHTSYVALARHREAATVFYASDDFGGRAAGATGETVKARFTETISRARPKELAHDYLEREPSVETATLADLVARDAGERIRRSERERVSGPSPMADLQARQQEADER